MVTFTIKYFHHVSLLTKLIEGQPDVNINIMSLIPRSTSEIMSETTDAAKQTYHSRCVCPWVYRIGTCKFSIHHRQLSPGLHLPQIRIAPSNSLANSAKHSFACAANLQHSLTMRTFKEDGFPLGRRFRSVDSATNLETASIRQSGDAILRMENIAVMGQKSIRDGGRCRQGTVCIVGSSKRSQSRRCIPASPAP